MLDFRLYVILDAEILRASFDVLVETARRIILAGADIIQLRAKTYPERKILALGLAIKKLTRKTKTLFLINDRLELALLVNADGIHLGQEDLPLEAARRILGKNKIIGISTHSIKQAICAEKQGADYLAIGPIFATLTKPKLAPLSPEIILEISRKIKIPFVAVGGINLENLDRVLSVGAERVAICRGIIRAKDVWAATKEFRRRLYLV